MLSDFKYNHTAQLSEPCLDTRNSMAQKTYKAVVWKVGSIESSIWPDLQGPPEGARGCRGSAADSALHVRKISVQKGGKLGLEVEHQVLLGRVTREWPLGHRLCLHVAGTCTVNGTHYSSTRFLSKALRKLFSGRHKLSKWRHWHRWSRKHISNHHQSF